MEYKEQIKEQELITKIRIIRYVLKEHIPTGFVAQAFSCHRNTITNIVATFTEKVSLEDKKALLYERRSFSQEELQKRFSGLRNLSRRPHSHKKAAGKNEERKILRLFEEKKIRVGVKRMKTFLRRHYEGSNIEEEQLMLKLTYGQLKGIYKRNMLKVQKVRSSNGERRSLYDYRALACFEKLHYDVKHILDKHALPEEIYQLLSGREIPKYEWNIIDAKSRMRFIAYSYDICAEFGLYFLLFVVQFIRSKLHNLDQTMIIGFDNGTEFCAGSNRKEKEWNTILNCMNAEVYSYEPNFDIRKNLIERSHLTDDEELYIPRGMFMGTKQGFIKEVTDYQSYWNTQRSHSGIEMDGRTPYEVVRQSGLIGVEKLISFPTLILDDVINQLKICTKSIEVDAYAMQYPDQMKKTLTDPKARRDLELKFFLPIDAQNVLTYYRTCGFGR